MKAIVKGGPLLRWLFLDFVPCNQPRPTGLRRSWGHAGGRFSRSPRTHFAVSADLWWDDLKRLVDHRSGVAWFYLRLALAWTGVAW